MDLNAESQSIARRDKKAFLSDQCKEIEENNRMGKIRHLFKKTRDTKGTFNAKDGLNKGQKCYGPIKSRRGGKNTQKYCTEKDLYDLDNHDDVITHLEPDRHPGM